LCLGAAYAVQDGVAFSGPRRAPGLDEVLSPTSGRGEPVDWGPLPRRKRAQFGGCFVRGVRPYRDCIDPVRCDVGMGGTGRKTVLAEGQGGSSVCGGKGGSNVCVGRVRDRGMGWGRGAVWGGARGEMEVVRRVGNCVQRDHVGGRVGKVTGTLGMFNVAHRHGEARCPGSWGLFSRRRSESEGKHRVARDKIWQVAGTLGLFNVALDHMRGDVARGKGREAYLGEAYLRRLGEGRGHPIVYRRRVVRSRRGPEEAWRAI
jgi:hypothetical protein